MTLVSELKRQWMQVPAFKAEYDALENEFSLARKLIEARTRAGLSQTELAQRMGTTQSTMPAWQMARRWQGSAVHANHYAYRCRYRLPAP